VAPVDLAAEVEALATALGLMRRGSLDPSFFSDPLARVRTIISDPDQRVGLLAALDAILPPSDDKITTADGETITRHPIVSTEIGSVALSIKRSGPAASPIVVVGLFAVAADDASKIRIDVDLPLVEASGADLDVVAGAPTNPIAVGVHVPLGWDTTTHPIGLQAVSLSALVLAPPNLANSRVAVELGGLDLGTGSVSDLTLDPMDIGADFSRALTMLIVAGLKQSAAATEDAVALLIDHLPSVVGLDGELPALPLGDLVSDPSAFRRWLASLTSTDIDGVSALYHWVDQIAQLLGAPALPAFTGSLPTADQPLVVTLADGGSSGATVEAQVWLTTPAASSVQELHVAFDVHVAGAVARLTGRAELLVVSLGGSAPSRALTSAEIVVESNAPLISGPADPLTVGIGRGGLRWNGSSIIPILELDKVHVDLPGVVQHATDFDRLDLTHAKTLAAEAKAAVGDFLTGSLGDGGPATVVLTLLGFSVPPTEAELGAFANDPLRAMGQFHRHALDTNAYHDVAQQIVGLFGVTTQITGSGTLDSPWSAPLARLAAPAASTLTFGLNVWDVPSGHDHELHIGLSVVAPPGATRPSWSLGLLVDLLSFRLPASAPAQAGLLGETRADLVLQLANLPEAAVRADELNVTLRWQPGSALTTDAAISGLVVVIDGHDNPISDLSLPDGLTPALANQAWPAIRALLARAARNWSGAVGSAIADLVGLSGSGATLPSTWPLIELPGGHLEQLVADPLEALRQRLAALVSTATDSDGRIPLLAALDQLRDVLAHALPTRPDLPAVPSAPQVTGTGSYGDPWCTPLTDASTPLVSEPIDLLCWMEPGPPRDWAAFARSLLDADDPDLSTAARGIGGFLGDVSDSVAGLSPDTVSRWLSATAESIDGTDGLVASDLTDLLPPGITAAATVSTAAHHVAPKNAEVVAAAKKHLQSNGAADVPAVFLAPSFAPGDVWVELLTGVSPDQVVHVDLRVPGVDPALVDLTNVTNGTYYLVDLADDGSATLELLNTRIHRVVERVREVTGAAKVAIVGHSIEGIAAVSYAAVHPEVCQACVAIGAPFAAGIPAVLQDPDAASGVRLARTLTPAGLPLPEVDAAVRHITSALDGYTGVSPTPYPVAAFERALPAGTNLSAVPTMAIPTRLEAPFTTTVAAALGAVFDTAPDTMPTHLAWGLRCALDLGDDDDLGVDLDARFDLGRVALSSGAPAPGHPAQRLTVDALVYRPEGWLVGSAGTGAPLDVRLRAARLRFENSDAGAAFTTTLYDGAVNGSGLPTMNVDDARSARLMGAFLDAVSTRAHPGTAALGLINLLTALEMVTFDPNTLAGSVRADAVEALRTDPAGWLGTRAVTLLQTQPAVLGLTPAAPQAGAPRSWHRALGALPVELVISSDPWAVGVRTTGAGIEIGDGASISLEALLPMAAPPSIDVSISAAGMTVTFAHGVVTLDAPPLLTDVQIFPITGQIGDQFVKALGPTGLAAAISAALQEALGGVLPVGSIVGLLHDPASWLADTRRFGNANGGFNADAVTALLTTLGDALNLPMESAGLELAEGMHIAATAPQTGVMRLGLSAAQLALDADGPTLDLGLSIDIAPTAVGWSARPAGIASITVPLDNGTWPSLAVGVSLDDAGFSLNVTPGGGSPIELLPHFAGLWDLLGGGVQALLPGVLDRLVQDLSPVDADSVLAHVLTVADGLALRTGAPPSFDSNALATLVTQVQSGALAPPPGAIAGLVTVLLPAGAPVAVDGSAGHIAVSIESLPVAGTAQLVADFAGAGTAPAIELHVTGIELGPASGVLHISDASGAFGFDLQLQIDVPTDLGFDFTPALSVSGVPLTVALSPLSATSQLALELAPTPGITPGRDALGDVLTAWAVPIVAKAALEAARSLLEEPLLTPPVGTPLTVHTLLRTAGLIVDDAGGVAQAVGRLPDAPAILRGLLAGLDVLRIPVSSDLAIGVYAEGTTWLGVGLFGEIDINAGDFVISALLGSPQVTSWINPPPGLGLLLLDDSAALTTRPGLRLGGIGVRVANKAGPLVDTDVLRIGDVAAMVQASLDLTGGSVGVTSLHGGVEVAQIGLPMGGSSNPSNPIAASLLKPSPDAGDDKPASPPSDLTVVSNDTGTLTVLINDKAAEQPFFIDIHKTFGPLHIDRIGLQHLLMGPVGDGIGALVDGGVSIAGLTVDVQGLELGIPLKHPAELDQWKVDLAGLALSFSAGPVSIEGGLLKSDLASGVEYDGQVKVEVGSFGLTALAGYSQAKGGEDAYTSLFVFVVVDAPIGGPPYLFITGLAGGAGYNRQLVVPADPGLIPNYPLVKAMSEGVGSDPMGALHQMSKAMPPRRGSYWVAAGVKFTTFELISTKALAYVALDRGFEVGLMGLMTMALPEPEHAVVSVELALLARYSSADQLLALRAQLTNNSWLISKDCQLTGGFAFYAWFGPKPSVLLTIGGTGPHWIDDPVHPVPHIPPVGFHWSVTSGIVVKGESYFAITPRQLAFGGRLEATGEFGPIRVWFEVHLDVEFSWDPLHYIIDAGISIGAEFHFTIDLFFTSITIDVTISIGGSIVIEGPPLHGSVTVDLEIASVTVEFGDAISPPGLSWPAFAAKFAGLLEAPNADETATGEGSSVATVVYGQLADSAKGPQNSGPHPDGTHDKPWQVLPEFGINVGSKMPLTRAVLGNKTVPGAGDPPPSNLEPGTFSIKPMGSAGNLFRAHLEIRIKANTAGGWVDIDVSAVTLGPTYGHFPVALWLVGGKEPPPAHRDMWLAVSGATMSFPVSIAEATGALGEASSIPISTLVEESDLVKPLPFISSPQVLVQTDLAALGKPPAVPAAAMDASTRVSDGAPKLIATTRRFGPAVTATHRFGTTAHAALAASSRSNGTEANLVSVDTGDAHVWTAPIGGGVFEGRGGGDLRVTTLSATGYVLDDREGPAEQLRFETHAYADRVVVTGLGMVSPGVDAAMGAVSLAARDDTEPAAGWQSGSVLTQVAHDTALGSGCAILLPCQVTAPQPAMLERRISAARLLSGLVGVQTLLPREVDVVIVLLDEQVPDATDDLVVVTGSGNPGEGSLGVPREVWAGSRRCLVYPVAEPPRVDRLAVAVASARRWRLAGVIGVHGDADEWAERLRDEPHPRLAREAPAGMASDYVLSDRQGVSA
jgi:hypothetical protein